MHEINLLIVRLGSWRLPENKDDQSGRTLSMQISLDIVDDTEIDESVRDEIAEEYISHDVVFAWPVWQALAYRSKTEWILRALHGKRRWFLDIGLIHNPRDSAQHTCYNRLAFRQRQQRAA
ncbi:MAG: hypothetical protein AAB449_02315 [Patescibacteria group bacterium]